MKGKMKTIKTLTAGVILAMAISSVIAECVIYVESSCHLA